MCSQPPCAEVALPAFRLTVAVPTYQRPRLLQQTLASIQEACCRTTTPVEVLVVDNASPDDTREVAQRYAGVIPDFRYECQDSNIGGEANFFSCIEKARGAHVWVVGDDDVVEPESVKAILRVLSEGANAVVVNYSVWSSDLQTCSKRAFFAESGTKVFESVDRVLETCGGGLGFTAAAVLNRNQVLKNSREEFMRYADVGLSFLDSAYRSLVGTRVAYLAVPLVKNRGDNSRDLRLGTVGWSSETWNRVFVVGIHQVLAGLSGQGYSDRAVRRARDRSVRLYVPERLRLLRRIREPCRTTVKCLLQNVYDVPSLWTHALPMFLVPRAVLRVTPWLRQFQQRHNTPRHDLPTSPPRPKP